MASEKQLTANRANAQLSTGPTSSEGKAKVFHNALKTGLTGRTVLLPSDDVAVYQAHEKSVPEIRAKKSVPGSVIPDFRPLVSTELVALFPTQVATKKLNISSSYTLQIVDQPPYAEGRRACHPL